MNSENFLKLGHKIKYLRCKNSMSQFDLSLKTGLTTRTISRIECGQIDPKYSTLLKISEALNLELTELFIFQF